MFIRPCYRSKNGKQHACWALVESYRAECGPRPRVVAWLGKLDEAGRLGIQKAATSAPSSSSSVTQPTLFDDLDDQTEPRSTGSA